MKMFIRLEGSEGVQFLAVNLAYFNKNLYFSLILVNTINQVKSSVLQDKFGYSVIYLEAWVTAITVKCLKKSILNLGYFSGGKKKNKKKLVCNF